MNIGQIRFRDNDSWSNLLDMVYPVGSMYISVDPTSPAELFGGTWEKIEGYFLRAGADTETGGSDTKTIAIENLPSHSHYMEHTHTMAHSHWMKHTHGASAWSGEAGWHTHTLYNRYNASELTKGGGAPRFRSDGGTWVTNYTSMDGAGTHTHGIGVSIGDSPEYTGEATPRTSGASSTNTGDTGSGTALDVMPKYKNVHAWQRLA